ESLPTVPVKPSVVIKKKDPNATPNWSHFEGQLEPQKPPEPSIPKTTEVLATISSAPPVIPPPPKKVDVVAPPVVPEPVEIKVVTPPPIPPSPIPKPEASKAQPRFAPPARSKFKVPGLMRY